MKLTKRISDKVEELLNERIKGELQSAQIYESMSNWCDCYGFFKAKAKYREYADEERKHMRKLIDYINDRNGIACTPLCIEVKSEYKNFLDVIKQSYVHECTVTDSYKKLIKIVKDDNDEVTSAFLLWFLTEQIEEEAKFGDTLCSADSLGLTDENCCNIEIFKLEELFVG